MLKQLTPGQQNTLDWEAFNVTIREEGQAIVLDYKGVDLLTIRMPDGLQALLIGQGRDIYKAIKAHDIPMDYLAQAYDIDKNNWGNPDLKNASSISLVEEGPRLVSKTSTPVYASDITDAFTMWRTNNDV